VNGFYIVEWAVVNDFAQVCVDSVSVDCEIPFLLLMQFDTFQRDIEATEMRALEIANVVDSVSCKSIIPPWV
jgi:hypothetical protein